MRTRRFLSGSCAQLFACRQRSCVLVTCCRHSGEAARKEKGQRTGSDGALLGVAFLTEKSAKCLGAGREGEGRACVRAHVCVNSKQARRRNARGRKTLYSAIHHSAAGWGWGGGSYGAHYGPASPSTRAWPSISDRQAFRPSVIRATRFINSSESK